MVGKVMMTENNVKVLRALMTGKYLKGSCSAAQEKELAVVTGVLTASPALRKLERMGVIAGYVPVLSEEGLRLLEAMEVAYGLVKDGKTTSGQPLQELVDH